MRPFCLSADHGASLVGNSSDNHAGGAYIAHSATCAIIEPMLNIRPAAPDDIPEILKLIRELAEYEKLAHLVVITADDIRRDGFSERPYFHVLIADWNGEPAGYALYFHNYSTFRGRPGLLLEDLFVRPRFRRKGIGEALLLHLAKVAVEAGCARFEWQVLDWNTPAIEF